MSKKRLSLIILFVFSIFTFVFSAFFVMDNFVTNRTKLQKQVTTELDTSFSEFNFTNLIVFVRFNDEDEFVDNLYDEVSVKNLIDNTYSKCDYNISDYFYSVSNGNIKMQNLYLFQNGQSLQLSKARGYYAEKDDTFNPDGYDSGEENLRRLDLIEDWTSAINSAFKNGAKPSSIDCSKEYPISELDKNQDGIIDAITIIYKNTTQNISVSWASPLWNYQYYTNLVTVEENGKSYQSSKYVQLTFTYENSSKTLNYLDKNNVRFLSPATAMHETSHIFGLLDLYCSNSSSQIYYMSLLGKPISPVGQFISNKEREAMGWINHNQIKSLSAEGMYKLDVTSSEILDSKKIIAYKLDLPNINKTLYLEYRNFKGEQNKFDSQDKILYMSNGEKLKQIYIKSGLVCYLVNSDMKIPTNLGTSGSNWNYLALGGTQSTKSDCAVGLNENIYVTNTLYIEVNSVSDSELEFAIYGDELQNVTHTHNLTHIAQTEPTCISTGNIEYYYCQDCDKYFLDSLAEQEIMASETVLQKTDHKKQVLPAVEPTCNKTGLTFGEKCSVCNKILTPQIVVDKKPHIAGDWIVDVEPTTESSGHKYKECTVCHTIVEESVIDKIPSHGGDTSNDNGSDDNSSTDYKKDENLTISIIVGVGLVSFISIFLIVKAKKKRKRLY